MYSSSNKFHELEKIQYEAARIALRCKSTTPRIFLRETLGIITIQQRLELMQIKMWHRLSRAPDHFLTGKTFKDWKDYMFNNFQARQHYTRNNRNRKHVDFNIHAMKHMKKSPLTRAYQLMYKLTTNGKVFVDRKPAVLKSAPCYHKEIPSNVSTSIDYHTAPKDGFHFYTDGSMYENPGPGAGAFYSPNFGIRAKMIPIMHDTTINYAELLSFKLVLSSVLNIYSNFKTKINNIYIFTDSMFCINLFNQDGYPKYNYYYKLMEAIIEIIYNIVALNCNIKIEIIKVKSHTGIEGNEIVDGIAKKGAEIANVCKRERFRKQKQYPELQYSTIDNPIMVDNTIFKKRWMYQFKDQKEEEIVNYCKDPWAVYDSDGKKINIMKFAGKGDFSNIFKDSKYNVPDWHDYSRFYLPELKVFTAQEIATIMKLRSEHINLNNYENFYFPGNANHDEHCQNCNKRVTETVHHILLECNQYQVERKRMFKKLKEIDIYFKQKRYRIRTADLLHPHLWQTHPSWNDEKRKEKIQNNIGVRVNILRTVKEFIQRIHRFNGEYGE